MQEISNVQKTVGPPLKKKRIRRRMINGVLVSGEKQPSNLNNVDVDKAIEDGGVDCQCKRYKCYILTNSDERKRVFTWFRQLGSTELQDLYLSDLITVEGVKHRRNRGERKRGENGKRNTASFFYKLKIPNADQSGAYKKLNVCRMAFLNILGISRNRLRATQKMLYNQRNRIPLDFGGQDKSLYEDLLVPEPLESLIIAQIDGYALSETYSVKDMHKQFLKRYRINVSYNTYWGIFHAKWNLAKYQPPYKVFPTFETFFETQRMFGLVDFNDND